MWDNNVDMKMKQILTSRIFLAPVILLIVLVIVGFARLTHTNPPCSDKLYGTEDSLPEDRSLICHVYLSGHYDHLPTWVFALTNLRTLNANGTNLQEIPAEIASLKRLE